MRINNVAPTDLMNPIFLIILLACIFFSIIISYVITEITKSKNSYKYYLLIDVFISSSFLITIAFIVLHNSLWYYTPNDFLL